MLRLKNWIKIILEVTMLISKNILVIFLSFILVMSLNGQIQTLKVGNVLPGQLDMGAFNLLEKSTVEITGIAASFDQWNEYLNYYSWIVETNSRNVVWKTTNCKEFEEEDGEFDVEKELELDPGNYEVYFAGGHDFHKFEFDGFDKFMGNIFKKRKESVNEYRDNFFVAITSSSEKFKIVDPEDLVDERNSKAIVAITHVGDYESVERKFSLSQDTKIKIYGIGESIKKQFYDFGYIYDVAKNERIWMFNMKDAEYAGGGNKNRKVEARLTLPKGSYIVKYITDDSHSFDEWNVLPPDDPQYWGITILPENDAESKNVIPFKESDIIRPIVNISKVQDDQFRSQGFTLSKEMDLRVLSVGEGKKEMADYGWIVNADTREAVWKMKSRNSEYAGGGKKNRMVDELINLDKGNYIAYYVTDDSHSFMNWNDAPPFQTEDWGIKIWTISKNDVAYVQLFNAEKFVSKNYIIGIVQVGDDEFISKKFVLDNDSQIRIVAVGEGTRNEMNDYGWIENENGKTVWEMKYKKTQHAGGAKKNRKFNDVISLPSGKYKVFYKSDDSHSFLEWNDNPPDEQERYGISIFYE